MHLILGSQSPRRKEILNYFSLSFDQISSNFNEAHISFSKDPEHYALAIARSKAEELSQKYPDAAILTADTIVYKDGKVYGKPEDLVHAIQMLNELSGKWHSVFTAVTLTYQREFYEGIEETKVLFNSLTEQQIHRYLNALHWADKAGGYAVQLAGSLIVKRIEGCYYNVMGLPINLVATLLKKIDIDLWDYLK